MLSWSAASIAPHTRGEPLTWSPQLSLHQLLQQQRISRSREAHSVYFVNPLPSSKSPLSQQLKVMNNALGLIRSVYRFRSALFYKYPGDYEIYSLSLCNALPIKNIFDC